MTIEEAIFSRLNERAVAVEAQLAKVKAGLLAADMEVLAEIDDLKAAADKLNEESQAAWALNRKLEHFGVS